MAFTKQRGPAGDRTPKEIVLEQNCFSSTEIANYSQQDFPVLWTCIGQECIGRVYERHGRFGAFGSKDQWIGEFPSRLAARAAIWTAHTAIAVSSIIDERRAAA